MKFNYITKILSLLFLFGLYSCGDNDIYLNNPNELNPDIPIIDLEPDDSYQEHLRFFDDGSTIIAVNEQVKFLTPYQLSNLVDYDDDEKMLYFDEKAERSRLPQIGDKIIYSPYTIGEVNALPCGVMGEVVSLETVSSRVTVQRGIGVRISQENLDFDDYFDEMEFESSPVVTSRKINNDNPRYQKDYKIHLVDLSAGLKTDGLDTDNLEAGVAINGKSDLYLHCYVALSKKKDYLDITMDLLSEMNSEIKLYTALGLDYKKFHKDFINIPVVSGIVAGPVYIPVFLSFKTSFYPILGAECSATTNLMCNDVLYKFRIGYDKGKPLYKIPGYEGPDLETFKWDLLGVDFNASAGIGLRLFPAISIAGCPFIDGSETCHADVTLTLDADARLSIDPENSYGPTTNEPIHFNFTGSVSFANIFDIFKKIKLNDEITFKVERPIADMYLYPTYKFWKYTENVETHTASISAVPFGDLVLPVKPGFAIYKGTPDNLNVLIGKMDSFIQSDGNYKSWWETRFTENPAERFSATFSGLEEGVTYTVVPYLGYFAGLLKLPAYGVPYYTFTFGNGDSEVVRRLREIRFPEFEGISTGGIITLDYDEEGRLSEYHDPFLDIDASINYASHSILFNTDDYYAWTNFSTNEKGYLQTALSEEGTLIFKYDGAGHILSITSPETSDTFEWEDGKLMRMVHKQLESGYTSVSDVKFEYSKEIETRHGQLPFFGNMYSFLIRGNMLGTPPLYLPTGVTIIESDDYETTTQNIGFEYSFDNDGYIMQEILVYYGFKLPFTYIYE